MNKGQGALLLASLLSGGLIIFSYKSDIQWGVNAGFLLLGASSGLLIGSYLAPPMCVTVQE